MGFVDRFKINKKIISIENFFLLIALFFGIAFAVIGTPFQECDGWDHFIRSMDVSYGNLLAPITPLNHESGKAVVPANYDDIDYKITDPASGEGAALKAHLKSIKPSKDKKTIEFNEGTMSLFFYPQAIGLFIGRHLGLSYFGFVLMGKLANFFVFLALTYWAIRITPILKNSMMVIALLPMTLYQAASFSPDSMLNGLCFLFAALCFYYAYGDKDKIGIKDMLVLGSILGIIFLCKYVYIMLGMLVFIIPKEKFGSNKEYFKKCMIALIPIVILGSIAISTVIGVVSTGTQSAAESIAESGSGTTPLAYIMQSPLNILRVLKYTLLVDFNTYVYWLNALGSLNYILEPLIYIIPMFMLYVTGSDVSKELELVKFKDKVIGLFTFLLIGACIIIGIYVGDTSVNSGDSILVMGVQGRYFIAAFPALAFALVPRKRINNDKYYSVKVLAFDICILLFSMMILRDNCY